MYGLSQMCSLPPAIVPWAENTENTCFLQGVQHNCNINLLQWFFSGCLVFLWVSVGWTCDEVISFFKKYEKAVSWHLYHLWDAHYSFIWKIWRHLCLRWVFLGYTATTTFPVTRLKSLVKTGWIFSTDTQLAGKLNFISAKDFMFWKVLGRGWKVKLSVSTTGTFPRFWNPLCSLTACWGALEPGNGKHPGPQLPASAWGCHQTRELQGPAL